MNYIKKQIPNFITCLNLACGFFGIIFSFEDLTVASWLIFLACGFDFLDGLAARLLKVTSNIGKELDSLADVVSFGVLPGLIIWQLFHVALTVNTISGKTPASELMFLSVLIPVFSAVRLAKFNLDARQVSGFIGLPTPANAILIAALPLIIEYSEFNTIDVNVLISLSIGMPLLLIAEIPLFALKFTSFRVKDNLIKYVFLLASAALLVVFQFLAIPAIIILYIILSLIIHLRKKG